MSFVDLTVWDVAAVSAFVLLNGALSLWLSLGIERQLLVAAVRMVIQLSAVGAVLTLGAAMVTLVALLGSLQPDPWYDPRYAIPLFGMILGNAMTGISLGLDTLTTAAVRDRAAIDTRIALGASRFEALRPTMREAMRRGMMPMINSMAATGVVFLPGMMTGQILAGIDPAQAVKYQLLIMFLISGSTGLGLLTAVVGGTWRLTDHRHRLRPDRLTGAR